MAVIRPARSSDAAALTEIAWDSKRHWGYPDAWMARWRAALEITPAYLETHAVFVAEEAGAAVGFCAVLRTEAGWDLDHLWIRPEFLGRGIGTELFTRAVGHIRAQGLPATLAIESEPHAEGFYARMGAIRVMTSVREWGGLRRELPCLSYRIEIYQN